MDKPGGTEVVTNVEPTKGRFDDDDVWGDEAENVSL